MKKNEENILVSVVLAVKDEIEYIQKCIDGILKQTLDRKKYEILIFDGNSTDGTREYLGELSKNISNIRIYDNPKIVAAAGWNEGFRISKAKYLLMMGGHTELSADFLQKNIEILDQYDVPCSGGRVMAVGEDVKSHAIALAFNHPFGVGDARYRYANKNCFVETVNFGMYRKSVTDSIGPINEDIKRGEDWEYNYRIVRKFGKMFYSPDIKSKYYSRSSFRKLWKRQFDAGKHKLEIIKKYPGSLLLRHLIPFIFALSIIILPVLTLLGLNINFLIILVLIYLLSNFFISAYLAIKNGFKYFSYLFIAFFIMHFAYGIGFINGLKFLFKK
jgi:glycosyltransferase involved in cell wall biosynthesis